MNRDHDEGGLSIQDLPALVLDLLTRAQRSPHSEEHGSLQLFVRYLRRKPGRGLAVIYSIGERGTARGIIQADYPRRAISLTLAESALAGSRIRFGASEIVQTALTFEAPGIICATEAGLAIQAFPADRGLPALAACCAPEQGSAFFEALENAARIQLHDSSWRLVAAAAEPVRYKPASRCVIRYHLDLERTAAGEPFRKRLALYGKVYANAQQARAIQENMRQLYEEQERIGSPILPQPLGLAEELGLLLSEAIGSGENEPEGVPLSGLSVLQPRMERERGGEIRALAVPEAELRITAEALARLHSSTVQPAGRPRTGAKEAQHVQERAALIAARNPEQTMWVEHLAHKLAAHLESLRPEAYLPAHGGFKASQLLFHSQRVFIVDFDGFCLADPALDIGYFLAYLRPGGLWYGRPGTRAWFAAASEAFVNAYRRAMRASGKHEASVECILQRVRFYEAALLFKIAARRVNRLNSPRPGELSAQLDEIALCLPL